MIKAVYNFPTIPVNSNNIMIPEANTKENKLTRKMTIHLLQSLFKMNISA